ncbi:bluetail domain-containing putative surface protein, partial [Cronbergia sp. UHCC 0137]|uniref:bluetail domain-containing putative surface protein n=1 Tax=Cronbergia sp. UHCC 0137 TaxID=3110239 RepID=UPI002B1FC24D
GNKDGNTLFYSNNEAPTADAGGPYTVNEGGTIVLNGSGTDPNANTTLTYAWDLDGDSVFGETGVDASRGDETGQTPTFQALTGPATVPISLRVSDGTLTDTVQVNVTINPTAQLSGITYLDADDDGVVDAGETRLAGITITLTGTENNGTAVNRTTTTATDGTYQFTNLFSGNYTLTETQLTGFNDGMDTVGTLGGTLGNDVFSNITVTAGANGTGYNFGEQNKPAPAPATGGTNLQASSGGQTLTGTSGINRLLGGAGNDIIVGGGNRDILAGRGGADIFQYPVLTDSIVDGNQVDIIGDFNQPEGDLFQVPFTPGNLFNAGLIGGANLSAALGTVYGSLGTQEAVFFQFGSRTYLSVNDSNAGFQSTNDLVADVTGIQFGSSLTVANYFV